MNKLLLIPVVGLVLLVDYLVGYYKPEFTLNEIRYFSKWIGIGVLYGGLMVYVIGVVIYKAWKKDADQ